MYDFLVRLNETLPGKDGIFQYTIVLLYSK